jgi:acyl-CoA synthetase (AMP-forming)/AMP-acid ligase II
MCASRGVSAVRSFLRSLPAYWATVVRALLRRDCSTAIEYVRGIASALAGVNLSTGSLEPSKRPARCGTLRPKEYRKIPNVDFCSWIFGNKDYDLDKAIYIDAHDPDHALSHNQCLSIVRKLVAGLRACGVRPGDTVCLHSYNHIYYSLIYLAITGVGGTFVGTNPAWTAVELTHFFQTTNVRFVVAEPDLIKTIELCASSCSIPRENIFVFTTSKQAPPATYRSWESLLEHGEEEWIVFDDEERSKSTAVAYMSTSGTTGLPKAAVISHHAHVAQSVMIEDNANKPYEIRRLCCLPQFHAFAGPLNNYSPIREGIPTFVMRRFNLPQYLEYMHEYQITETHMVNPIGLSVLSQPVDRQRLLDSLRTIWIAGAPLDCETQNKLATLFNPVARFIQVYGMTEIGWITTLQYPETDDTGTTGRLLPNMEARIVDVNGVAHTEDSAHGEIQLRGPSLMSSYLNNTKATSETIVDGWLRSGDVGYQLGGKLYIVDRVKDIIKVRGWQVSPTELEATLLAHPHIRDCAVIGVDFADGKGEVPRAYIVTTGQLNDEEVNRWMSERLAKYKQLAGGIRRVAAIPRGGAGKILKRLFQQEFKAESERLGDSCAKGHDLHNGHAAKVAVGGGENVVVFG